MIDVGKGRRVIATQVDPFVLEDRDFIAAVRGGRAGSRCVRGGSADAPARMRPGALGERRTRNRVDAGARTCLTGERSLPRIRLARAAVHLELPRGAAHRRLLPDRDLVLGFRRNGADLPQGTNPPPTAGTSGSAPSTTRRRFGYPVAFVGYMEVGRVVETRADAVEAGSTVRWPTGTRRGTRRMRRQTLHVRRRARARYSASTARR